MDEPRVVLIKLSDKEEAQRNIEVQTDGSLHFCTIPSGYLIKVPKGYWEKTPEGWNIFDFINDAKIPGKWVNQKP